MLASRLWPRFLIAVLVGLPLSSFATDVCEVSTQPAATLLFPYFEVDLADAQGRTTLISISNAGDEATVARLTVWSNVGLPSLSFDLVLDPRDVQSINLRNLLAGQIPLTDIDAELTNCEDPLVLPDLDENGVADLVAWHTGVADSGGLCRGVAGDEPDLATGYITVDAMNQCAPYFAYPNDHIVYQGNIHYFEDGGAGLASNANVLWGDLILLDPAGDAAQSVAAVHIRADAERFSGQTRTFYGYGADDRAPLPSTYRGRFLAGQPAGTETSFLLWLDPVTMAFFGPAGFTCGEASFHTNLCLFLEAQAYDEAGTPIGDPLVETPFTVLRPLTIAPDAGAGFIEVRHQELVACFLIPVGFEPVQSVLIPLLKADGRFSAATAAVGLDSTCFEPVP